MDIQSDKQTIKLFQDKIKNKEILSNSELLHYKECLSRQIEKSNKQTQILLTLSIIFSLTALFIRIYTDFIHH